MHYHCIDAIKHSYKASSYCWCCRKRQQMAHGLCWTHVRMESWIPEQSSDFSMTKSQRSKQVSRVMMPMLVTTWALGVTAAMCGAACCCSPAISALWPPSCRLSCRMQNVIQAWAARPGKLLNSGQRVIITKKSWRKTDIITYVFTVFRGTILKFFLFWLLIA